MQIKLIWLVVSSFNYWFYGFGATSLIFFLVFGFFVTLVQFEILSHNPKNNSSQWLREGVQWITNKIFREKFMV